MEVNVKDRDTKNTASGSNLDKAKRLQSEWLGERKSQIKERVERIKKQTSEKLGEDIGVYGFYYSYKKAEDGYPEPHEFIVYERQLEDGSTSLFITKEDEQGNIIDTADITKKANENNPDPRLLKLSDYLNNYGLGSDS